MWITDKEYKDTLNKQVFPAAGGEYLRNKGIKCAYSLFSVSINKKDVSQRHPFLVQVM